MRHRRILLLFVATFAILATTTYVVLTSTGATGAFVRRTLAQFLHADLQLGSADLDPTTGKLRISGLQIRPRMPAGRAESSLHVGDVLVDIATNPLGTFGSVRSVHVREVDFQLDLTTGTPPALHELLNLPELDLAGEGPSALPAVLIEDSRLGIRIVGDAEPIRFEDVDLTLLREEGTAARYVLSGSALSPAGFRATFSGFCDLAGKQLRVLVDVRDVALTPALLHSYSADAEALLAEAKLAGRARRLSLWFEYPADADGTAGFAAGGSVEFSDVSLVVPEVEQPLYGIDGRAFLSTRAGGEVKFELSRSGGPGTLTARGAVQQVFRGAPLAHLELRAAGIPVDEQLAATMRRIPAGQRIWDAFTPSGGQADVDLRLDNRESGGPLLASVDVQLHGVDGSFEGLPVATDPKQVRFPYRIDDLSGLVQVRPGGQVAVHGLHGTRPDGARITVHASRDGGAGDGSLQVDVAATNLQFGDELRRGLAALLPAEGARVYDEFAPAGRTDVHVRVHGEPGLPVRYSVELRPLGASACWHGFPLRVDGMHGLIRIADDGVSFRVDAERRDPGAEAAARVSLDGRFLDALDPDRMRSELWIRVDAIPLDDELERCIRGLGPSLGRMLDELQPSGRSGAEIALWRPAGAADFHYDLRLDLAGAGLVPQQIGLPLQQLQGPVFVHGDAQQVTIRLGIVRGVLPPAAAGPPATLLLQGTQIATAGADGEFTLLPDLHVVVRGLELDDRLADALDAQGIFSLRTWERLRPGGNVDLVLRRHSDPDGTLRNRLRVFLRGVTSAAEMLPGRATDLTGEIVVEDREVRFEEIHGRIEGRPVVVTDGSIRPIDGGSVLELNVAAAELAVDEKLGNLMSEPLRLAYLQRRATGRVTVDDCWLRIEMFDAPETYRTEFRGSFVARDVGLDMVIRVEHVQGPFRVAHAATDGAGGRIEFSAEGMSFELVGHRISDFAVTGVADPDQVVCDRVEGRLHSGRIRQRRGTDGAPPPLRYRFAGDGELAVLLDFEGISLSEFMRAATAAPTRLRGTVNGSVQLDRLIGTDLVDAEAHGTLQVRDGQLGVVPIFTQIFAALDPELRPHFDGLGLAATIGNRRIEVRQLELTSPILTVQGEGTIDMDGHVDMVLEFPNLFGHTGDLLVLPRVLTFVGGRFIRFHLYGYLRHLYARSRTFWQDDPGRRPFEPLPALGR